MAGTGGPTVSKGDSAYPDFYDDMGNLEIKKQNLDRHLGRSTKRDKKKREIYIFPWLQVHITGPRHHLTSSLRSYAQGYNKTRRYLQYISSMVF